ncbi:MAG: N-6 DNA methylase [Bacteroidales bacterium]|nr:N-6 DNA methylase [Bacteroidales bacterium]
MSKLKIQAYYKKLENLIQYGGSRNEQSIRNAFENLLGSYCEPKNFILVPELHYQTKQNNTIIFDGTIKDALRLDWGYWEAKDTKDDLDKEIENKLAKGYPNENILFENSETAILIQNGNEVARVDMQDPNKLDSILNQFLNYERPEVHDFRQAINKFKDDLPTVVDTLRTTLDQQKKSKTKFKAAFKKLFNLCKESINPKINDFDIGEMVIQHILTEEIFLTVFSESQFHKENIIAQQLDSVVNTFFTGKTRRDTLQSIESYYAVIKRQAANIQDYHEKQKFLKIIYENFYKSYNPKAADRLGVVYTPNEIVRFMIESTDYLLDKHFNTLLAEKNVEILDPCTGTGTFITELINYLPKNALKYKYQNEIHCNEVAILPYYIANLNIEYTYQQRMGEYEAFPHICFVDTLDNMGFDHEYDNQQKTLFKFNDENTERIQSQNWILDSSKKRKFLKREISVIIGNPPYNAKQQNENDNNKNREYDEIDKLIKNTYVEKSTAQKTNAYDMYARFFRWASSRLNDDGILAFITNNSFLDASSFDGFRQVVEQEFNEIYVVDLGGDIRKGSKENVFNVKVGIAISFFIKIKGATSCKIYYVKSPNTEKLQFLMDNSFKQLDFARIMPDKNYNWLNITNNDFDDLLPLATKETKLVKNPKDEQAVFKLFSKGTMTGRDDWVYDFNKEYLQSKTKYFLNEYNSELIRWEEYKKANTYKDIKEESNPVVDDFLQERNIIKWSSRLKRDKLRKGKKEESNPVVGDIKWSKMIKRDKFRKNKKAKFSNKNIRKSLYRPFTSMYLYFGYIPIDLRGQLDEIFPSLKEKNTIIAFNYNCKIFTTVATDNLIEYGSLLVGGGSTQCLPLYRYSPDGTRIDNITDWGLKQFQNHYQDQIITKLDIFHYTYAVLHNPLYREKYALNLKREFPRLPFYDDFTKWVNMGKKLMDLHINYEKVKKYPLKRIDIETKGLNKPKLKADKDAGKIYLDNQTTLQGIPKIAWQYKLGNRSALEWVLDQYKEKKPRDKTIAEKFNTYRFADYKEQVIDLLKQVCTVSVETMRVIEKMN